MDNQIARRDVTELEVIRELAADERVSVEKLSALMQLHERAEARNAEKLYHAAMAEMQPLLPRVAKNGSIDLGGNKLVSFARWEDVDAVLRPILSKHGFCLSFPTRVDGEKLLMSCVVSHVAGHSERSEAVVASDAKLAQRMNSLQATGSGRSYTKRYLALDMLNIVTIGADDDANSADPITEEQAMGLQTMIDYLAMEPSRLAKFWAFVGGGVHRVEDIQRKDFDRVSSSLRTECRKKEGR